ncbi:hypothetical protein Sinac_1343 [Singulisphaera acidiphila DSM 18658]|uniref:Uncharacterized protein n=1 Tax=Singulisphaera acidiphila (strain ATCC BAA-1392 / DSM 18658 / VKM B-2454 / MOB10) TaxID=886293 RepID=L0DA40_SINAD|nr:hypothetical protein Sinac_1343 [Singulisphaera acidiphila DSM 18658]
MILAKVIDLGENQEIIELAILTRLPEPKLGYKVHFVPALSCISGTLESVTASPTLTSGLRE